MCIFASCDPKHEDIIEPTQPPIEQPEQPGTPEEPSQPEEPEEPAKPSPIAGIININNEYMIVGNKTWNAITYGNGIYVAVGDYTNTTTSADGINWTEPKKIGGGVDAPNYQLTSVAYGNGKFVAIGTSGWYSTSTDGISWSTAKQTPLKETVSSVIFVNDKFYAASSSSVLTSVDGGETWTSKYIYYYTFHTIMYGDNKFVLIASTGQVYVSTDGVDWVKNAEFSQQRDWNKGTFGGGKFVSASTSKGYFMVSTDPRTWVEYPVGGSYWKCITYGNGKFVAINYYDTIYTSEDAINWTQGERLATNFGSKAVIFMQ